MDLTKKMMKLKYFKKGEIDKAYFVLIILFVILLVFFVYFLDNFQESMGEKAFSETCNQYLKAHMIGKKLFDGQFKGGNENPCQTEDVAIKSDNNYDAMGEVAKKMTECYNTYYRGEVNLFLGERGEDVTFCSICHKINFESKDIEIKNYEWMSFLSTQKYITGEKYMSILGSDVYLKAYLNNKESFSTATVNGKNVDLSQNIIFDGNQEYITLFVYNKTEDLSAIQKVVKGLVTGVVVGGVVAGGVIIGGAIIVVSGGTAIPIFLATDLLVLGGTVGGISGAGMAINKIVDNGESGSKWIASIQTVPYDAETLKKIKCDYVVGMSGQGIENKPY